MDSNNFNNDYSQFDNSAYTPAPQPEQKGLSIASLVLGICGFIACCLPIIGYPVTITGLVLGILGSKKGGKGMAIAGIITSSIALLLTLLNSILGAYIATTGQLY